MFLNRFFKFALLAGMLVSAPVWAQTSTISCPAAFTAGAGGTWSAQCTIAFQLGAVQADSAGIGVQASGAGPAATVTFTNALATAPGINQSSGASVSAAWSGITPKLTGNVTLGTVNISIPTGATAGQTYTVSFNNGEPTINCCGTFGSPLSISPGAAQTVAIPTVLTIAPPSGTLTAWTAGLPFSKSITTSGGTAPITFSLSGSWPAGFSVTNATTTTATITGTFPAAATYTNNLTVTAKDSSSPQETATATYSLTVNPAITAVAPTTLPGGTVGAAYSSGNITVTGGTAPYTFSTTANLDGLTLSPSGATAATITGTPSSGVTGLSIPLKVTDANGATFTGNLTLTITGIAITSPPAGALTSATVGTAYAKGTGVTITSAGGTGTTAWSITAGALPTGLTLGASGATTTITGTPTGAPGASTFTVQAMDANGKTATQQYSITVYAAPVVTGPATLSTATVGSAYTTSPYTLTGGAPTVVWTATGLPSGLSIAGGTISGTPTTNAASPYTVKVTVTDANGATASTGNASLPVNPALTVSPASLPVAIPGVAYSQKLTPGGGSGTTTLALTGLPGTTGLTFSNGTISGTPSATSNPQTPLVVTVTDSTTGATATFNYTLVVAPPLSISTTAAAPAGTVKVGYVGFTIAAAGGTPPYSWSASNLPPGLSISTFNGNGAISGTPTALAGSPYTVTVTVTDSNRTTASKNFTIAVGALPLQIITGFLPAGVINAPYPFTSINAQGGVGNFSWSITGLPPGLTTDGNGDISGTPTTATGSPFSVVVSVTDATQRTVSRTFSLAISNVLTVAGPATLPAATLNAPYTPTTVTAGGGLAPYTWAATGLPAGLSIGIATGIISGTPTSASGSPYSVTVTVTDSTGKTATMNYTLAVGTGVTITGPASLPAATLGAAYTSTTITAAGGSGTYTWSATGLPSGLSIAATTGAITGTPTGTTAGTATVVVTVTDTSSNTASKTYTLTINPASGSPTITSVSTSAGGQMFIAPNTWISIYGTNFTATGFTDNWTNSIKNSATGALPTTLDNVSVMVGSVPAYVYYISATQINVLTGNIGFGPLAVMVTNGTGSSNVVMATSQAQIPAFFEWANASGQTPGDTSQQPVATHSDYSYAAANGTFGTTPSVAAAPGETITLWGSGFGTTSPANPFGVAVPSTGSYTTTQNVSVTLNGAPITVVNNNAILTPGDAGLYQVGVTIPSGLANGTYPITVSVNGVQSPTLSLAVQLQ